MMMLKTVQPITLRNLFDSLKDIIQDVNIKFDSKGIKMITYDTARVSLIDLYLSSDNFEEYSCPQEIIAGVNITNTFKILKTITQNDTLEMSIKNTDEMILEIFNTQKKSSTKYALKLLDIDDDYINQPELGMSCITTMPSVNFQKICRDMTNLLATKTVIERKSNNISFACFGDFANQTTQFECEEYNGHPISGTFSLKYLSMFSKTSTLCVNVQFIHCETDGPILIKYLVSNLGELNFYIHSLITDDD
jgi:proliferating cell nuclear antigen